MQKRLKKFLNFILGLTFIPPFLGRISASVFGESYFKSFFGYFLIVYLLMYFTFPFLYSKDTPKMFSNKYTFYAVAYLIFWIFGTILFVGYRI